MRRVRNGMKIIKSLLSSAYIMLGTIALFYDNITILLYLILMLLIFIESDISDMLKNRDK